tara:strand:- start:231 stop:821 length:591 start_codon:yes stop_codon:yes gene_type:complete
MKHLNNIPICSNALFIYHLDIKNSLVLKFSKEKFRSTASTMLMTEDLNILKKYKELSKEINKAIDATLTKILALKNTKYRIFSSWITQTHPRDSSAGSHVHSNSWLSGVYYPKGDPGFSIKFFNDHTPTFFTPPIKYNIYNSTDWTIVPEDNFLILFFSQLRHKIMPNQSNNPRFSLSFNILPKGEIGEGDSKTIL